MTAYIDTNVAVWLTQGSLDRISSKAQHILRESKLLVSPMVLLELEYLYEVRRTLTSARDIQVKLEHELRVEVCRFDFLSIVDAGLHEKWTRDPFDRMIVAHAKANGLAQLVSADAEIRTHYQRAIW